MQEGSAGQMLFPTCDMGLRDSGSEAVSLQCSFNSTSLSASAALAKKIIFQK